MNSQRTALAAIHHDRRRDSRSGGRRIWIIGKYGGFEILGIAALLLAIVIAKRSRRRRRRVSARRLHRSPQPGQSWSSGCATWESVRAASVPDDNAPRPPDSRRSRGSRAAWTRRCSRPAIPARRQRLRSGTTSTRCLPGFGQREADLVASARRSIHAALVRPSVSGCRVAGGCRHVRDQQVRGCLPLGGSVRRESPACRGVATQVRVGLSFLDVVDRSRDKSVAHSSEADASCAAAVMQLRFRPVVRRVAPMPTTVSSYPPLNVACTRLDCCCWVRRTSCWSGSYR